MSRAAIAEEALGVWLRLLPTGYVAPVSSVRRSLESMFQGESPGFIIQRLRPQNDKVHFLYFWKVFSEAARLECADPPSELEILRDRILLHMEKKKGSITKDSLMHLFQRTEEESSYRGFWQKALKEKLDATSTLGFWDGPGTC